jgi:hypothetical protein
MHDTTQRRLPLYGIAGVAMVLIFWAINWHLPGLRSHWAFFPLWLGYILLVDGLTYLRKGTSLLSRNWKSWIILFIVSAPTWWIFEWLNQVTQYWEYLGVESFSDLQYNIQASISFSTVIPAVVSTAELINTLPFSKRFEKGPKIGGRTSTQIIFFVIGWVMLVSLLIWPAYGAAFMWMSLFFILDPVNHWLGYTSILKTTASGSWRIVFNLWTASLICGFLWELWNFYSFPKWIYDVPYVDFWYDFEMPLLGYLGYLPFALELFAMLHLVLGLLRIPSSVHLSK